MHSETRTREVVFADWLAKARYLDGAAWDDARRPLVRDMARRIGGNVDPNRADVRAERLFDFCKRAIRYVPDPASEEFSDAEAILLQGFGDCDDKVRLFVALARSLGLEARVRPVLTPARPGEEDPDFVHVQAEVRWPGSYRMPRARAGGWLVAELILRDARLGDDAGDVPNRILI